MDMGGLNVSATLNVFRLITKPSLCLPHAKVKTFNDLPVPLNGLFEGGRYRNVNIKAVVLDKDNCFAVPHENGVYKPYEDKFASLKTHYPGRRLLIVSNTAGALSHDPHLHLSRAVTSSTGIPVLTHSTKKPGCNEEIMEYFKRYPETGVTKPEEVAFVGDRLLTDVLGANLMGSYGVWVSKGVVGERGQGVFAKVERKFAEFLVRRGYEAPDPSSPFEE